MILHTPCSCAGQPLQLFPSYSCGKKNIGAQIRLKDSLPTDQLARSIALITGVVVIGALAKVMSRPLIWAGEASRRLSPTAILVAAISAAADSDRPRAALANRVVR